MSVRDRRLAAGIGVLDFAERVGITPSRLCQIEQNPKGDPGGPALAFIDTVDTAGNRNGRLGYVEMGAIRAPSKEELAAIERVLEGDQ